MMVDKPSLGARRVPRWSILEVVMRRSVVASSLCAALLVGCPNGLEPAFAGPDTATDAGAGVETGPASVLDEAARGAGACFNFMDEDLDGSLDCSDPSCRTRSQPACCVGLATDGCCAPAGAPAAVVSCTGPECLSFEGEELEPLRGAVWDVAMTECHAAVRAFGPIGDAMNHGRIVLPRVYSTASSFLTLQGTIHIGTSTEVSAAGFGIMGAQDAGPRVTPLVAVVGSASANELRVIVGDRVVGTMPLGSNACARTVSVRLELEPNGAFRMTSGGGGAAVRGVIDPSPSVRVVMFGQQPNPMGYPETWLSDVSVSSRACDVLLPARSTTSILGDAEHDLSDFSIFRGPSGTHEALVASNGELHWFGVNTRTGGLTPDPRTPAFGNAIGGDAFITDVDVFESPEGTRMVVVAVRDNASLNSRLLIGRLQYPAGPMAGPTPSLVDVRPLIDPSALADTDIVASLTSVDSPSAVVFNGTIRIAFRAHEGGRSSLRLATILGTSYEADSARTASAFVDGVVAAGFIHAPSTTQVDAFDRDEVADPELYVEDGILRVLFAGRRGTRWSIRTLVASADATRFAPAAAPPFLPSGQGFDALGALAPELVLVPASDRLYYLGTDGIRRSIGLATQPR